MIAVPLLLLAAAACEEEDITPLSDSGPVLGSIPWTTPETATYNVRQGDTVGKGTFQILEGVDSLVFIQNYDIRDNEVTDEITAEADPETLRPVRVRRVTTDPDFKRDCTATYAGGTVTVVQKDEGDENTAEVSVPSTHYDSWTDIFLWRTIEFKEGFETRYADVLSCNPRESEVITVSLEVKGVEHVTVPAGSIEVWHLKIDSGGSTQDAWYSTDDSRILVKYDNGPQVFELTSLD